MVLQRVSGHFSFTDSISYPLTFTRGLIRKYLKNLFIHCKINFRSITYHLSCVLDSVFFQSSKCEFHVENMSQT